MEDMMLMQFIIDLFGADTIEMMKEEGLPTENIVNLSVREQQVENISLPVQQSYPDMSE